MASCGERLCALIERDKSTYNRSNDSTAEAPYTEAIHVAIVHFNPGRYVAEARTQKVDCHDWDKEWNAKQKLKHNIYRGGNNSGYENPTLERPTVK